jgi:hypothetical protein
LGILGNLAADRTGEAGICEEREDGSERGGSEKAMIELHEGWILEHVAPPQVGLVGHMAVKGVK